MLMAESLTMRRTHVLICMADAWKYCMNIIKAKDG